MTSTASFADPRSGFIRRGKQLQYLTIAWNSLEAILAVGAGLLAGSVALVGFGVDSVIEVSSGVASLWRLNRDASSSRDRVEKQTLRLIGFCFLALAAYVGYDSIRMLAHHEAPEESTTGIAIAVASLIAMPLLARAKRRVASGLGSAALRADARQTDFCLYLSAILLAGLLLNAALGLWWADPVAALIMVPIISSEGIKSLRGQACDCSSSCC